MINYMYFDAISKKIRLRETASSNSFWLEALQMLLKPSKAKRAVEMFGASYITDVQKMMKEQYIGHGLLYTYVSHNIFVIYASDPDFANSRLLIKGLLKDHERVGSVIIVGNNADQVQSLPKIVEDYYINKAKDNLIKFG